MFWFRVVSTKGTKESLTAVFVSFVNRLRV